MSDLFPLISICIPVYNRIGIISATLLSALSQDYPNFEVVISDNYSDDGTYERLADFALTDDRIRLFRMACNEGPVRNWQNCLQMAQGDYVKFLWSDDYLCETFLSDCIALFSENVGFVYSSVRFFDVDLSTLSTQTRYGLSHSGLFSSDMFINRVISGYDFPVSGSCALFRTSLVAQALGLGLVPNAYGLDFNKNGAGPDALMFLVSADAYPQFGHISSPLCYFGTGFGSISMSQGRRLRPFYYYAFRYFLEQYYPILLSRFKTLGYFELCLWRGDVEIKARYDRIVRGIDAPLDYLFGMVLVGRYTVNFLVGFLRRICRGVTKLYVAMRRFCHV